VLSLLTLTGALAACGAGNQGEEDMRGITPAATRPATPGGPAQASPAALLRLVRVGGSFHRPLYVTAPPGDRRRIFVVEQTGQIKVVRDGRKLPASFLNLSSRVSCCDERGLLSMAFAPDYATSGRFYVSYTDRAGDSRVVEYRRSTPDRANPGSARLVLFHRQPESNHNGGLVVFGPDRLLYVGLGDGGGADDRHGGRGNAQNLGTLLGKLLRIDPRPGAGRPYRIPAGNPFVRRRGVRPEIYAYGLRNPWRFSFDRVTGNMIIADVGQNAIEEINFVLRGRAAGRNYGWRVWEGRRRNYPGETAQNATFPVFTYPLESGRCSITGGYVVRDRALRGYYGRYLYGDYCAGVIRSLLLGPGTARFDAQAAPSVSSLSSFGEDALGRIYVTSLDGPVYRLAP
jgi:glucose/arabinose dehydrogenase